MVELYSQLVQKWSASPSIVQVIICKLSFVSAFSHFPLQILQRWCKDDGSFTPVTNPAVLTKYRDLLLSL
jgi:hypothetical protein